MAAAKLTRGPLAVIVVGVVTVVAIAWVVSHARPPHERGDVDRALSDSAFAAAVGSTIDIGSIAAFDWTEMHVFETCLDQNVIDRSLVFYFDTSELRKREYCYDMETGRPLVIFTTGTTVNGWVVLNAERHRAIFFDTDADGTLAVPRAGAVFKVRGGPSERDLGRVP